MLIDLPEVVAGAGPALAGAGVRDRCAVTRGSSFDSAPDGGDAYLLKSIIHGWDDESSLIILGNVRTAIPRDGKLLSTQVLVHTGGRERTAAEHSNLLSQPDFRLKRAIPTAGSAAILEAVPV